MADDNNVPFPRRMRAVPTPVPVPDTTRVAVNHEGRPYLLDELLRCLTQDERRRIAQSVPKSGQDLWDAVGRGSPALADEIAAGVALAS